MTTDIVPRVDTETARTTGTIGLGAAVALAVILGVHPPGSTDLYDDGAEFVEHISVFWMAIHVVAAIVMLAFPLVIGAWGASLGSPRARVVGRLTGLVAILGTALGVLHLVGTDTVSFAFYEDTLESGEVGAGVGADVLLRIHASTLTSWIIAFWLGVQCTAVVAAWLDRRRGWQLTLPALGAALAVASVAVTVVERQYTTVSEMLLFRSSVTVFIVWIGLVSYTMRRDAVR